MLSSRSYTQLHCTEQLGLVLMERMRWLLLPLPYQKQIWVQLKHGGSGGYVDLARLAQADDVEGCDTLKMLLPKKNTEKVEKSALAWQRARRGL